MCSMHIHFWNKFSSKRNKNWNWWPRQIKIWREIESTEAIYIYVEWGEKQQRKIEWAQIPKICYYITCNSEQCILSGPATFTPLSDKCYKINILNGITFSHLEAFSSFLMPNIYRPFSFVCVFVSWSWPIHTLTKAEKKKKKMVRRAQQIECMRASFYD